MSRVYRSRPVAPRVVRSGGARELRIDGTFASLYRPGHATTGSVWDAIASAALARRKGAPRHVLLLGLGGGSAARVVRALAPEARITAVEIDAEVVRLARAHFDLDELGLEVHVADALAFLARSRSRYDLILEDLFVGDEAHLRKPDGLLGPGLARLQRRLGAGGVVAHNTLDETAAVARELEAGPGVPLEIRVEGFDNRILVAGDRVRARSLRAAVARSPVLRETVSRLSFRERRPGTGARSR